MTRETILAHIAFLAKHEPVYAEKALRWYAKLLPWFEFARAGFPC